MVTNKWLFAAGILSALAAALHLGCVAGGPSWYRFLGAGQPLVRLAECNSPIPTFYAVGIAAVLLGWSAYAFSGAGALPRLPLLRPILVAISAVYLLRAAAMPVMLVYATGPGRSASFVVWSSIIVLLYGLVHAVGVASAWPDLKGAASASGSADVTTKGVR
jgi:hypothetical protein